MLIQFERTGGFAGLKMAFMLNTETLSSAEACKLDELVESAQFFDLPTKFPSPKNGADYFMYKVTVEKDGRKHTVDVSEPEVPESLRPLLQYLSKKIQT